MSTELVDIFKLDLSKAKCALCQAPLRSDRGLTQGIVVNPGYEGADQGWDVLLPSGKSYHFPELPLGLYCWHCLHALAKRNNFPETVKQSCLQCGRKYYDAPNLVHRVISYGEALDERRQAVGGYDSAFDTQCMEFPRLQPLTWYCHACLKSEITTGHATRCDNAACGPRGRSRRAARKKQKKPR